MQQPPSLISIRGNMCVRSAHHDSQPMIPSMISVRRLYMWSIKSPWKVQPRVSLLGYLLFIPCFINQLKKGLNFIMPFAHKLAKHRKILQKSCSAGTGLQPKFHRVRIVATGSKIIYCLTMKFTTMQLQLVHRENTMCSHDDHFTL